MNKTIYLAGSPEVDGDEFDEVCAKLVDKEYFVVNTDLDYSLRDVLQQLAQVDAICLMPYWWTSMEAIAAQTIATWLRLPVIDPFDLEPVDDFKRAKK